MATRITDGERYRYPETISVQHGVANIIVVVIFTVCVGIVGFSFAYLQNTTLGLALSLASILVGYESLYLVRKLTRPNVTRRERGRGGQPASIAQFLHDVRAEMKRVSFPTLNEVKNTTIITLIAVVFFAVYLFAVDQGLSRLILGLDWLIEKIARFLGPA
jgi:preprotein translocase subunit SecE